MALLLISLLLISCQSNSPKSIASRLPQSNIQNKFAPESLECKVYGGLFERSNRIKIFHDGELLIEARPKMPLYRLGETCQFINLQKRIAQKRKVNLVMNTEFYDALQERIAPKWWHQGTNLYRIGKLFRLEYPKQKEHWILTSFGMIHFLNDQKISVKSEDNYIAVTIDNIPSLKLDAGDDDASVITKNINSILASKTDEDQVTLTSGFNYSKSPLYKNMFFTSYNFFKKNK